MIPELGQFALTIALLLALTQAVFPLIGAHRGNASWIALAAPAGQAQFIFVATAFCCLAYSFITNDFSVLNVATNSNSQLPLQYRLAATWGSHEGSLLLWTLMLALWTVAVTLFSRHLPAEMVARVLSVMGVVSVGFLLFMLLTSNPFARLFPAAPDGRDLNPLLQDPAMVAHPPMLYMGYVGFSVAFAFAISALDWLLTGLDFSLSHLTASLPTLWRCSIVASSAAAPSPLTIASTIAACALRTRLEK